MAHINTRVKAIVEYSKLKNKEKKINKQNNNQKKSI